MEFTRWLGAKHRLSWTSSVQTAPEEMNSMKKLKKQRFLASIAK
jgi:hypothetical protein